MTSMTNLKSNVLSGGKSIVDTVTEFSRTNPIISGGVVALGGASIVTGLVTIVKSRRKKKAKGKARRKVKRKIKHTRRGWAQDRRLKSKQKWEVAYRRRKKLKSSRTTKKRVGKIYKTKTGQPYKILRSGKARFIKRQKGGRY